MEFRFNGVESVVEPIGVIDLVARLQQLLPRGGQDLAEITKGDDDVNILDTDGVDDQLRRGIVGLRKELTRAHRHTGE